MKLIPVLFALAAITLTVLATISALAWADTQLAIGAVIAAALCAGFAMLGDVLSRKQVAQ